jgi:hypothetical protein
MANSNEVTSPAAPVPTVSTAPTTNEQSGDVGKKGNVTSAAATRHLTRTFLARVEAEAKAAAPVEGSSSIAAANTESPAAPKEAAKSPDQSEAKPKAAPTQVETHEAQKPTAEESEEIPEVLSNFSHLDPKTREIVEAALKATKDKWQESVNKRIGKEVAKRKGLEETLTQIRSQMPVQSPLDMAQRAAPQQNQQPAQAPVYVPPPSDQPLAHINDLASLNQEYTTAKELRRVADDLITAGPNPDGKFVIEGRELTRDQIVNIRRNASVMLEDHIPQRMNFLNLRQQNKAQAEADFPWIKDPTSPDFQLAATVANQYGWVKNLPNAELMLGVVVEGLRSLEARKQGKANSAVKSARSFAEPPSDQTSFTSSAGTPSRQPGAINRQALADERAKLASKKGVSSRDAEKFLLASAQLRNSR